MNYKNLVQIQRREIVALKYNSYKQRIITDIEILEQIDFAVVEKFVREKKLKNIKK